MPGTLIDLGQAIKPNGEPNFGGNGNIRPDGRVDPSAKLSGAAPNMGQFLLPHFLSFQGVVSTVSRTYRASDEALKDSYENARFMRNDPTIMECVEARQRAVALLNYHIEPPDAKDMRMVETGQRMSKILDQIPRFMQYRENLLHASFFGKYAVQHRWQWRRIDGTMRVAMTRWKPIHGDKLVFRYDPDDKTWDDDQPGIRVGTGYSAGHTIAGRWPVEKARWVDPTDIGLAYFLRTWERPLLAIHKHYIEDGEYEDPVNAGKIHGVGIRSRIYWVWYQKQETLAWLMEFLERSAAGFEIWYYPWGNESARDQVLSAARDRVGLGRNVVLVPKMIGQDQFGQWYDRIEPSMAGAEALRTIVMEYFGHLLKRYILGQTLTTEAGSTGLGSNLADVHLATFLQIVQYDATLLEETITTDLLNPIISYNFPWASGLGFKFRIDTKSENAQEKLLAYQAGWQMGLAIKAQDVYDLLGASKPEPDDQVLVSMPMPAAPADSAGAPPATGAPPSEGYQRIGKMERYSPEFEAKHPREGDGTFREKGDKEITPPRNLLAPQERILLRKHLTGDVGRHTWKSVHALIQAGYLATRDGKLIVTQKGKNYCDHHHASISLEEPEHYQRVREAELYARLANMGYREILELTRQAVQPHANDLNAGTIGPAHVQAVAAALEQHFGPGAIHPRALHKELTENGIVGHASDSIARHISRAAELVRSKENLAIMAAQDAAKRAAKFGPKERKHAWETPTASVEAAVKRWEDPSMGKQFKSLKGQTGLFEDIDPSQIAQPKEPARPQKSLFQGEETEGYYADPTDIRSPEGVGFQSQIPAGPKREISGPELVGHDPTADRPAPQLGDHVRNLTILHPLVASGKVSDQESKHWRDWVGTLHAATQAVAPEGWRVTLHQGGRGERFLVGNQLGTDKRVWIRAGKMHLPQHWADYQIVPGVSGNDYTSHLAAIAKLFEGRTQRPELQTAKQPAKVMASKAGLTEKFAKAFAAVGLGK